jgi:molybdopterin molybdotransferase
MKALISPCEARRLILAHLPPIPTIACPIDKCAGRILQETVKTDRPLPPFNRSMMDGYAIRAAEITLTGTFSICAHISAGSPAQVLNDKLGSCAEIMTGAVVPSGADCIVPYETTELLSDGRIRLLKPAEHFSGSCIHPAGSDHPANGTLLNENTRLGAREIAIAATCGYSQLQVSKIPAIAIVSTGDELVDVDVTPAPHQIRCSNDLSIKTALSNAKLSATTRTHLHDDITLSKIKLAELIRSNTFVIISGGISMGTKDYIPTALDELGLVNHFHGVKQKPGKPFGFWSSADCAVFTLPGNPLSTLVALHHYVIPAIEHAMGAPEKHSTHSVQLVDPIKTRDDITVFLPVQLEANNTARSNPAQNSGDLVRILHSDGYIALPPTIKGTYPAEQCFEFFQWL